MFRSRTDAEYIAHVRRGVAWKDRWRWWMVGVYLILAVTWVALGTMAIQMLGRIGQRNNAGLAIIGFITGIIIGVAFGFATLKMTYEFLHFLLPSRTERLMLRYHDAIVHIAESQKADAIVGEMTRNETIVKS